MNLETTKLVTGRSEIEVRTIGNGEPIVVVGGGPGLSCDYLIKPLAGLAHDRRLVFFDQPGCGRSVSYDAPTADETTTATAKVISAAVGDAPYSLVAHSWGAYLVARYSLGASRQPRTTILLNPTPLDRTSFDQVGIRLAQRIAPKTLEIIGALALKETPDAGRELMREAMPGYCGRSDHLPNLDFDYSIRTFNSVAATLDQFDYWRALSNLDKLNLVFGDTDYIRLSDFQNHLTSDARVHSVASGHFSMLDAPAEVGRIIVEACS